MPLKKGDKRSWSVNSSDPEVRKKRSNSLKGIHHPRKNGNYHPPVSVKCKICEIGFSKPYAVWNRSISKKFYCSKCNPTKFKRGQKSHNSKPKIQSHCDYCGNQLERVESQYHIYDKHFCNQRCSGKWKSKNITGNKVYNWRGGHNSYYGENWLRQRRGCIARDSNVCQICNLTSNLDKSNMDVDHKIPFRLFSNYKDANILENLWCLCKKCHSIKTNWQNTITSTNIDDWKYLIQDLLNRKYIWN